MKKRSKKLMEFLFGTKYPIFNNKGEIVHSRKKMVKKWKEKYLKDPDYNWRNHAGKYFIDSKKHS